MKHSLTAKVSAAFKPLIRSRGVQAALMVLKPGATSSDSMKSEHPGAEQWLFVISGTGRARVGRRSVMLAPGSLLLIARRESHQIINTGRRPLRTLNLYHPPAYGKDCEVLPSVKRPAPRR